MARNVIIIHGGDSYKKYEEYLQVLQSNPVRIKDNLKSWKSSLQTQLGDSYKVIVPEFPNPQNAHYTEWQIVFNHLKSYIDEQTILIGHSLGGMFLTQYLSHNLMKIAQLHLVASGLSSEGSFLAPSDCTAIQLGSQSIHIWHSVDDEVVPFASSLALKKSIPKAHLHQFVGKGHFNQTEFPELIEMIVQC